MAHERNPHLHIVSERSTEQWRKQAYDDMLELAAKFWGPRYLAEGGPEQWSDVDDNNSILGKAVTNGIERFVYGPSVKGDKWGLQRVKRDKNGRLSISAQALRDPEEEYRPDRPKPIETDNESSLRALGRRVFGSPPDQQSY